MFGCLNQEEPDHLIAKGPELLVRLALTVEVMKFTWQDILIGKSVANVAGYSPSQVIMIA